MSLILLANVSNEIRSDDVLKKKTNKKKKTGNKVRSGACKRDSDREINPASLRLMNLSCSSVSPLMKSKNYFCISA